MNLTGFTESHGFPDSSDMKREKNNNNKITAEVKCSSFAANSQSEPFLGLEVKICHDSRDGHGVVTLSVERGGKSSDSPPRVSPPKYTVVRKSALQPPTCPVTPRRWQ